MVLLDALRIFDEKNRDVVAAPEPVAVHQQATEQTVAPPLLQVVSADKQLEGRLANALPEAIVARGALRDAGTVGPGEGTPFLLVDRRAGRMAPDGTGQL